MNIIIQDFTHVYNEQPFMQQLRTHKNVCWVDFSKLNGTDYYCDNESIIDIQNKINQEITNNKNFDKIDVHFFDNGNFHYMSKIWIDKIEKPFTLIVFDHHPDMQEPRFGDILSCGGWLKQLLENNTFIKKVILIGVQDNLINKNSDAGKLLHSECKSILNKVIFIKESELNDFKLSNLDSQLQKTDSIYYSIDKDVFTKEIAYTNWDQGSLTFENFEKFMNYFSKNHKTLGVDICGERDFKETLNNKKAYTKLNPDILNNNLNEKIFNLLQKNLCL